MKRNKPGNAVLQPGQEPCNNKRTPKASLPLFAGSRSEQEKGAEALASKLGKQLYRADLSQLVSKYIGETEKNLNALFAQAGKDTILLLDEADALFGRRTGVKDAHDRYANRFTKLVLDKLNSFPGPVIVATQNQSGIAPSIARRFSSVICWGEDC